MFYNPYPNMNYQQRLNQMEQFQQMNVPQAQVQTIQNVQPNNPGVQCFFVNSRADLQNMQVNPNTIYIGINKQSKEIYTRCWNNDGVIDFDTYSLSDGQKENSEMKVILDKLENIENRLRGQDERSIANVNAAGNVGADAKQSSNVAV